MRKLEEKRQKRRGLADPHCPGTVPFGFRPFTLQVLPGELRRKALEAIASFVAPGGAALLVARGREPSDDPGHMPWPLTKDEMRSVAELALDGDIDDFMDDEDVPVRRFVGVLRRP